MLFGVAGLFGAWLALSPVAIVLGRTDRRARAGGAGRRDGRPAPARARSRAQRRRARAALGGVLRRDPGRRRGGRAARLRESFRSGRSSRARRGRAARRPPRLGRRGAGRRRARLDRAPVRPARPGRPGLAWGVLLLGRDVRVAGGAQPALRPNGDGALSIALWQNAFAALVLVPVVALWPGRGPLAHTRRARRPSRRSGSAARRSRTRSSRHSPASPRAHRERRRGARAGLRHRAARRCWASDRPRACWRAAARNARRGGGRRGRGPHPGLPADAAGRMPS